ncbi:redoxin family protein [Filifactor alocis]|uniref:redoxin family protein n=1 Tax=Filifactor alocis TaxID=143361 RepID=UPI003FA153E9
MNQVINVEHFNFLLVFLEGLVSFFSPCILPILPIYLGYLAGQSEKDVKKNKIVNMLFFGVGIALSFFILGMAFTGIGKFFDTNKAMFSRIGGVIVLLLGLYQIGFYQSDFLNRERRIKPLWGTGKVGPLVALLMGFTFSFAWTPCVGPMLSSVLIMASGAKTALLGKVLVGVYAVGFLIPFVVFGIFTDFIMNFVEKKTRLFQWIPKLGGVLLIVMGLIIFTGKFNSITGYWSSMSVQEQQKTVESEHTNQKEEKQEQSEEKKDSNQQAETIPGWNFEEKDQNGTVHTLEQYRGKVVLLNFWASWCGPCNAELPDIEELYQEYGQNSKDVIILGVTNPKSDDFLQSADVTESELKEFIKGKAFDFPTMMNSSGSIFADYQVGAFPTTFILDKEGNIVGYSQGALPKDVLKDAIEKLR